MSSNGDDQEAGNAELNVTMLDGTVDPITCGTKVFVEIRLRGVIRRFPPVDVDPSTGSFSYEDAPGLRLTGFTLDDIWEDHFLILLRSWHPVSDWTDTAALRVPVQIIGIGEECDYQTFVLEHTDGDNTNNDGKPQLVLRATLTSEFRPSVEAAARLLQGYTTTVDRTLDAVAEQTDRIIPYLSSRYALVPAVPIGVFLLASLPLVCVLGVVGLPLLVPVMVVVVAVAGVVALLGGAVWAGSRSGRARVQQIVRPVLEKFSNDPEVLYPIGPRPSPVRIVRSLMPTTMWPKLGMSVLVDFIGCTSYAVPILGEGADLLWAPMSLILIDSMYHESTPWAAWFGAAEELLPFTDIIPTATLAWLKEYAPTLISEFQGALLGTVQARRGEVYDSNGNGPTGPEYTYEPRHAHSS